MATLDQAPGRTQNPSFQTPTSRGSHWSPDSSCWSLPAPADPRPSPTSRDRRLAGPPCPPLASTCSTALSLFRIVVRVGGDVGRPGLACATAAERRPSAGRPVSCSGGRGAGVGSLPPPLAFSPFSFPRQGLRPLYLFFIFIIFCFFFLFFLLDNYRVASTFNTSLSTCHVHN